MKEKLLFFGSLLLLIAGGAGIPMNVCAQEDGVFPEMSTGDHIVYYTIRSGRNGVGNRYVHYMGESTAMYQYGTVQDETALFYFTEKTVEGLSDDVKCVEIHNAAAEGLKCASINSWTEADRDWYLKWFTPSNGGAKGFAICTDATFPDNNSVAWNDAGNRGQALGWWKPDDINSVWLIENVEDHLKTEATERLDELKRLPALFSEENIINEAKTEVSAIAWTSLAEVKEKINAALDKVYRTADDKSIYLMTNGRGGDHWLCVNTNSKAAATETKGHDCIWTLNYVGDGAYTMHNFLKNVYLSPMPTEDNVALPVTASAIGAGCYTLSVKGDDLAAFENSNYAVHESNWASHEIVRWYATEVSSQWHIEEIGTLALTLEAYNTATDKLYSLIYPLQQNSGLVQDASNYVCNKPETAGNEPSSYAHLLDGEYGTYFHSSWSNTGTDAHYLQADLQEPVSQFYFYFKKRQDNNNNRPTSITISGSNDGETFTEIQTISSGLPVSSDKLDYLSALVKSSEAYRYIRFTVNSTSNSTIFFTFSEFYVLPNTEDVKAVVDLAAEWNGIDLGNAEVVQATMNTINQTKAEQELAIYKKEAKQMLADNENNHADVPALGQYITQAYNNLKTTYDQTLTVEGLEALNAALDAFKRSQNRPLFTIDNQHPGYGLGNSIYDAGQDQPKWKARDVADRTMLWSLVATSGDNPYVREIEGGEYTADNNHNYTVCNFGTGNLLWPSKGNYVTVYNTVPKDETDGSVLLKMANTAFSQNGNIWLHAQNYGQMVVLWNTKTAHSASAWVVTYVCDSYLYDQIAADEANGGLAYISAYSAMKRARLALESYRDYTCDETESDATHVHKVGYYDTASMENKEEMEADYTKAMTLLAEAWAQKDGDFSKEKIEALTARLQGYIAAIRAVQVLPESGRTYCFRTSARKRYIYAQNEDDAGLKITSSTDRTEDETQVYFTVTEGVVNAAEKSLTGKLKTVAGRYVSARVEKADAADAGTFILRPHPVVPGAFEITIGGGNQHWDSQTVDNLTLQQTGASTHETAWLLEEVKTYDLTVSAAGAATLYLDFNAYIPEGLTAKYVSSETAEAVGEGMYRLTYESFEEVLPTANGAVVTGEPDATPYTFYECTREVTAPASNLLIGGTIPENTDNLYALAKKNDRLAFYRFADTSFKVYKAYLQIVIPGVEASQVKGFILADDHVTGVESVESVSGDEKEDRIYYDLVGRRVLKPVKGIYISNGKKVYINK